MAEAVDFAVREIEGRYRGDRGEIQGRSRGDTGEIEELQHEHGALSADPPPPVRSQVREIEELQHEDLASRACLQCLPREAARVQALGLGLGCRVS